MVEDNDLKRRLTSMKNGGEYGILKLGREGNHKTPHALLRFK